MSDEQNEPKPKEPLKRLSDIVALPVAERAREELRILEQMMATAVHRGDFSGALKAFESAHEIIKRAPGPR